MFESPDRLPLPDASAEAAAPGLRLCDLPLRCPARVAGLVVPGQGHGHGRPLVLRLLEIGFVEGERVEVVALGPGGREPLAVRVGNSQFALRRHEAEHVLVQRLEQAP